MNVSDFTGQKLKKSFGLKRAVKNYQNRHVDGSGNFGFVLVYDSPQGYNGEAWFTLSGVYDPSGTVKLLHFAPYISAGQSLYPDEYETYDKMVDAVLKRKTEMGAYRP